MSNTTNLTGLDFVESAGAALKAAQELAVGVVAEGEKVAVAVPIQVDMLREHDYIQDTEKEAAAAQLGSHEGALAVVGNLIQIGAEQKQAYEQKIAQLNQKLGLGGPGEGDTSGHKSASAGNGRTTDDLSAGGIVGQRAGSEELRASDMPLLKAAGIHKQFPA